MIIFDEYPYMTPGLKCPDPDPIWLKEIEMLAQQYDIVFALTSEMHPTVVTETYSYLLKKYPNIYFIVSGHLNNMTEYNHRFLSFQFWLEEVKLAYQHPQLETTILQKLCSQPKLKSFDMLLGTEKMLRNMFYYSIVNHNSDLLDKSYLTYFRNSDSKAWNNFSYDKTVLKNVKTDYFVTGQYVRYQADPTLPATDVRLSYLISPEIYNQTNFTVIPETGWSNEYSFFTEKTAKPILAKRMFLALTGYQFLKNLRREGFRTFGNVVDESYDLEPDDRKRVPMIVDQIRRISEMDPEKVLRKIKPIVDHNYEVLIQTDWSAKTMNRIMECTKRHVENSQDSRITAMSASLAFQNTQYQRWCVSLSRNMGSAR